MYIKKNEKGVTLVELIISIALLLIVLQVIYSIFFVGSDSLSVSTNKGFSQQGVRNTNIFLESELKYANSFYSEQQVTEGIPNTDFYGISLDNDYLVVSKYSIIKNSVPTNYNVTEVRRFRSESDEILINNTDMGLITISLGQSESSGRRTSNFNLQHHIYLEDGSLLSNLVWDLSNDEDSVYFSKIQDSVKGSIILKNTSNDNQNGGSTQSTSTISIDDLVVYKFNDKGKKEVVKMINNKYTVGNKGSYEIVLTYKYNGAQTLLVDASSTTQPLVDKTHDKNDKIIIVPGTGPQGNDPDVTITITLHASDAKSITQKITISK